MDRAYLYTGERTQLGAPAASEVGGPVFRQRGAYARVLVDGVRRVPYTAELEENGWRVLMVGDRGESRRANADVLHARERTATSSERVFHDLTEFS